MKTCKDCKYFRGGGRYYGECRLKPPDGWFFPFPEVPLTDWCGEFKERKDKD